MRPLRKRPAEIAASMACSVEKGDERVPALLDIRGGVHGGGGLGHSGRSWLLMRKGAPDR